MFAEPATTRYDLHFRLAGVPVRVHPFFWFISALLGFTARDPVFMVMWVGVVFVSILVHEFGHAFAMRRFGESPRIVLYSFGGLTIADPAPWGRTWATLPRSAQEQIVISAAGPAAGFLLAGLVIATAVALGFGLGFGVVTPSTSLLTSPGFKYLGELIFQLLWVNIGWGVINLLPVHPLDGGSISRSLFVIGDPLRGVEKSLWVSVVVGAAVAVLGLIVLKNPFIGVLFGLLAFSSYSLLQGAGARRM